jgi:hypothetical protein
MAIENLQNHSIKLAVLIYSFCFWLVRYICSQRPNTKKKKKKEKRQKCQVSMPDLIHSFWSDILLRK